MNGSGLSDGGHSNRDDDDDVGIIDAKHAATLDEIDAEVTAELDGVDDDFNLGDLLADSRASTTTKTTAATSAVAAAATAAARRTTATWTRSWRRKSRGSLEQDHPASDCAPLPLALVALHLLRLFGIVSTRLMVLSLFFFLDRIWKFHVIWSIFHVHVTSHDEPHGGQRSTKWVKTPGCGCCCSCCCCCCCCG